MDLVHAFLADTLVKYLALVGVWGLVQGARGFGPGPSYRGALGVAEIAIVVQGLVGVFLLTSRPPQNGVHVLYGVALLVALPLAATMVRGRQPRGQSVALGLAALFAMGLALRGIQTA